MYISFCFNCYRMKLLTFWLAYCFALLYSGECVDGHRIHQQAHRGLQHRMSQNDQLQETASITGPSYVHPHNWFIYTNSYNHAQLIPPRIMFYPFFYQTACHRRMRGEYACYIYYYYYPETTPKNEETPTEVTSATTELNDEIDSTTLASENTEMTTETYSIASRFDDTPIVDFNVYYNTNTGVDLKKVKPLRPPTIRIPPANHRNGATKITNSEPSAGGRPDDSAMVFENTPAFLEKRPLPASGNRPTPQKKESNDDKTNVYSHITTTRSTTRRRNKPTRRRTTKTSASKLGTFPTTTPFLPKSDDQDQDSVSFYNAEEDLLSKQNGLINKPNTSTTVIPLMPSTNKKAGHAHNVQGSIQTNQYELSFTDK